MNNGRLFTSSQPPPQINKSIEVCSCLLPSGLHNDMKLSRIFYAYFFIFCFNFSPFLYWHALIYFFSFLFLHASISFFFRFLFLACLNFVIVFFLVFFFSCMRQLRLSIVVFFCHFLLISCIRQFCFSLFFRFFFLFLSFRFTSVFLRM